MPALELSPAFELLEDLPPARTELTRKGAMVLLVDDEDQLRRVMKDLLERQGYTVVEARDGAQALDEVDRHTPDIMILDLNLPGVDGYSVLSQLRSRPATRQLPIIVLTAKGDEDNEVRVLAARRRRFPHQAVPGQGPGGQPRERACTERGQ